MFRLVFVTILVFHIASIAMHICLGVFGSDASWPGSSTARLRHAALLLYTGSLPHTAVCFLLPECFLVLLTPLPALAQLCCKLLL